MAAFLYDKGREAFLNGDISWGRDAIKAVMVDLGAYTADSALHQYLSDVPGGARYGTPVTLASKTVVAGVADAADVSITGIVAAPTLEGILIYQDTGNAATSRLIALIDTATGLPVAGGATHIDIAWSNGATKLFKL